MTLLLKSLFLAQHSVFFQLLLMLLFEKVIFYATFVTLF